MNGQLPPQDAALRLFQDSELSQVVSAINAFNSDVLHASSDEHLRKNLPVILVTGPTGSGKSTFLNRLCRAWIFPCRLMENSSVPTVMPNDPLTTCPIELEMTPLSQSEAPADGQWILEIMDGDKVGCTEHFHPDSVASINTIRQHLLQRMRKKQTQAKPFSAEPLRVKVRGHGCQPLHLIDLPGIHGAAQVQSFENEPWKISEKYISTFANATILVVANAQSIRTDHVIKRLLELRDRVGAASAVSAASTGTEKRTTLLVVQKADDFGDPNSLSNFVQWLRKPGSGEIDVTETPTSRCKKFVVVNPSVQSLEPQAAFDALAAADAREGAFFNQSACWASVRGLHGDQAVGFGMVAVLASLEDAVKTSLQHSLSKIISLVHDIIAQNRARLCDIEKGMSIAPWESLADVDVNLTDMQGIHRRNAVVSVCARLCDAMHRILADSDNPNQDHISLSMRSTQALAEFVAAVRGCTVIERMKDDESARVIAEIQRANAPLSGVINGEFQLSSNHRSLFLHRILLPEILKFFTKYADEMHQLMKEAFERALPLVDPVGCLHARFVTEIKSIILSRLAVLRKEVQEQAKSFFSMLCAPGAGCDPLHVSLFGLSADDVSALLVALAQPATANALSRQKSVLDDVRQLLERGFVGNTISIASRASASATPQAAQQPLNGPRPLAIIAAASGPVANNLSPVRANPVPVYSGAAPSPGVVREPSHEENRKRELRMWAAYMKSQLVSVLPGLVCGATVEGFLHEGKFMYNQGAQLAGWLGMSDNMVSVSRLDQVTRRLCSAIGINERMWDEKSALLKETKALCEALLRTRKVSGQYASWFPGLSADVDAMVADFERCAL